MLRSDGLAGRCLHKKMHSLCGGFASESLHENLIRSSRRLKSNGHTDGLAGESLRIERDGLVGKSLHEDMRRTTRSRG